ncbi:hypothetical protein ACOJR9_04385 [Alteromonas sp. A081]|uniref:hypothetical protein n=1 Tax=Alteromonas sp. A081 TaxID=3410269 RepID=UPI003B97F042
MNKFSPSQRELLEFFGDGGIVEFCTSVGSQLGATSFPKGKPMRFNKLVMNSLFKYGLLRVAKEECSYGLRWSQVVISQRGLDILKKWVIADENY